MMDPAEEINALTEYAARILAIRPEECKSMHFASRIGASQYVRIAQEIRARIPGPRVLDWGSGFGQNTLLLLRAGLEVHSFDVRGRYRAYFDLAIPPEKLRYMLGADGTRLPYEDSFFDGALSCGVLEHVPDEQGSLAEILRVLRPGGLFFVYHLPNRRSYTEYRNRRAGRFFHDRTYDRGEIERIFSAAGFEVLSLSPYHFLPRIFVEQRAGLRRLLDPRHDLFNRVDGWLARTPPFSLFATAWQVLARKPA